MDIMKLCVELLAYFGRSDAQCTLRSSFVLLQDDE